MFRVSALLRLSACGLRHGTFKQGTRNEADSSSSHGLYDKFEYSDDDFVAVDPPNMNVSLLPFQKMGVGWMLHREARFSGGIMADHLGMGKTVQMIGLCMSADAKDSAAFKKVNAKAAGNKMKDKKHDGNRLLTVVRQMQRISVLQNCSKLTQPGLELGTLAEAIEKELEAKTFQFLPQAKEVKKWLDYAGKYHPAYRRKAEAFLRAETEAVFEEFDSPELRTLVVVPASLVLQWKSEILAKVSPERNISVHIFHGEGKKIGVTEIETFDFVITTYETLSNNISNLVVEDMDGSSAFNREDASPLFRAKWKRCILDEAHVIRNKKTLRWNAVKHIQAQKRWAVTATPLHNTIEDIQNLLEFVGSPTLPMLPERNDAEALLRDDALQKSIADCLQPVFLRRGPVMVVNSKKTVLVDLPVKEEMVKTAALSLEETKLYNDVLTRSRSAIESSTGKKTFHVFAMMTRLRQTCCHPALSMGKAVQVYLCGICKGEASSPILTKCGHAFCHECILARFRVDGEAGGDEGMAVRTPCPVCDYTINFSTLAAAKTMSSSEHIAKIRASEWKSSTKIDMILHELNHVRNEFGDDKVVLFSHFTSFLDHISVALERHNLGFVRIDGSMPIVQRNQVVNTFQHSKTAKVLLASKTAVGVGLNLTMANHVLIVDPWWNPAIEEQAIHRCHRIGQKKPVFVKRFVTDGTIEQYCFEICQKKKEFGDSVLKAATGGDAAASQKAHSKMMQLVGNLELIGDKK